MSDRAAFESWARTDEGNCSEIDLRLSMDESGICYADPLVDRDFEVWQAAMAHVVPDGWQLVPIEPTPEMLQAAVKCRHGGATYRCTTAKAEEGDALDDYLAMLKAAPTPPKPPQ